MRWNPAVTRADSLCISVITCWQVLCRELGKPSCFAGLSLAFLLDELQLVP